MGEWEIVRGASHGHCSKMQVKRATVTTTACRGKAQQSHGEGLYVSFVHGIVSLQNGLGPARSLAASTGMAVASQRVKNASIFQVTRKCCYTSITRFCHRATETSLN